MKGKILFKFVVVLIGLIFAFMLTSTSTADAAMPINIGYTTDLSGQTAMFGVVEVPVIKMVVEEVNAAGGLNGRPINLIVRDHRGDIATMMGHLKMFKQLDKCPVVLQGVASATGMAAKKWAEENHIPVLTPDSASDQLITREGKAWYFQTCWPQGCQTLSAINTVAARGYKKVGFGATALALGDQWIPILNKRGPELGVTITAIVRCEPKTKDLTIQVKQLKDSGADALIISDYEAESGVWARAIKSLGWNPYVFAGFSTCTVNALSMYPPELFEGWEIYLVVDDTKPIVKEIWDKAEKRTGKRYENELQPRAYDAIMLTLEAIKLGGNPDDPEAVREGFYKIRDFPIASGGEKTGYFEIGRSYLVGCEGVPIYRITSGKLVKVD